MLRRYHTMKRALLGLLIGCLTMGFASVALAGQNADAGIALHVTKATTKATLCSGAPDWNGKGARDFKTKGVPCPTGVGEFDVWVVVCGGSDSVGVAGAEWGLEYDGAFGSGVDVNSWTRCGDLEFPSGGYPAAGGGNLVTFEPGGNCQNTNAETGPMGVPVKKTVIAVLGILDVTVWGGDNLAVVARPVSGKLAVADCAAKEDLLSDDTDAGTATFCANRPGYNPCIKKALAIESETWGGIKSKYEIN
jgi:hypothetical protein